MYTKIYSVPLTLLLISNTLYSMRPYEKKIVINGMPYLRTIEHITPNRLETCIRTVTTKQLVGAISYKNDADDGYIHLLKVDPACRRNGIGAYLFNHVKAFYERNDHTMFEWTAVPLDVSLDQDRAIIFGILVRWYEKLGGTVLHSSPPAMAKMRLQITPAPTVQSSSDKAH